MILATLDTNVLVSGLAGLAVPTSAPGAIIRFWLDGMFEVAISAEILAELEKTLSKPYYTSRRSPEQIDAVRQVFGTATMVALTTVIQGAATHPEDDVVLATAISARADYLVTGDKQLQRLDVYQGVRVLSPCAFLDLLEAFGDEPS